MRQHVRNAKRADNIVVKGGSIAEPWAATWQLQEDAYINGQVGIYRTDKDFECTVNGEPVAVPEQSQS